MCNQTRLARCRQPATDLPRAARRRGRHSPGRGLALAPLGSRLRAPRPAQKSTPPRPAADEPPPGNPFNKRALVGFLAHDETATQSACASMSVYVYL